MLMVRTEHLERIFVRNQLPSLGKEYSGIFGSVEGEGGYDRAQGRAQALQRSQDLYRPWMSAIMLIERSLRN